MTASIFDIVQTLEPSQDLPGAFLFKSGRVIGALIEDGISLHAIELYAERARNEPPQHQLCIFWITGAMGIYERVLVEAPFPKEIGSKLVLMGFLPCSILPALGRPRKIGAIWNRSAPLPLGDPFGEEISPAARQFRGMVKKMNRERLK